jgi:hypothetical protein
VLTLVEDVVYLLTGREYDMDETLDVDSSQ